MLINKQAQKSISGLRVCACECVYTIDAQHTHMVKGTLESNHKETERDSISLFSPEYF